MNKDNAKEFLPLIQALADGKTIQFKASCEWEDLSGVSVVFCGELNQYRIKPNKPREWSCAITAAGHLLDADIHYPANRQIIKVREILD